MFNIIKFSSGMRVALFDKPKSDCKRCSCAMKIIDKSNKVKRLGHNDAPSNTTIVKKVVNRLGMVKETMPRVRFKVV